MVIIAPKPMVRSCTLIKAFKNFVWDVYGARRSLCSRASWMFKLRSGETLLTAFVIECLQVTDRLKEELPSHSKVFLTALHPKIAHSSWACLCRLSPTIVWNWEGDAVRRSRQAESWKPLAHSPSRSLVFVFCLCWLVTMKILHPEMCNMHASRGS